MQSVVYYYYYYCCCCCCCYYYYYYWCYCYCARWKKLGQYLVTK